MSKLSLLQENNILEGSEEYDIYNKKLDKIMDKVHRLDCIRVVTISHFISLRKALKEVEDLEGDFGECDIHDLTKFLYEAPLIFDKDFISRVVIKVSGLCEFNPKSKGYDKKPLDMYLKMIDQIKSTQE